jgi:hypothetical protein
MEVGRVKILGKVENLVCRILRRFSTEIIIWFDVLVDRGKCEVRVTNKKHALTAFKL